MVLLLHSGTLCGKRSHTVEGVREKPVPVLENRLDESEFRVAPVACGSRIAAIKPKAKTRKWSFGSNARCLYGQRLALEFTGWLYEEIAAPGSLPHRILS